MQKSVNLFAGIGGFRPAAERCGGTCVGYSEIYGGAIATNDYVTACSVAATDAETYRTQFLQEVFPKGRYRRITRQEACRIQGFPGVFGKIG